MAKEELLEMRGQVVELLPNSYNTGHRVFYTPSGESASPLRVVVDRHSADQQLLTALDRAGAGDQREVAAADPPPAPHRRSQLRRARSR